MVFTSVFWNERRKELSNKISNSLKGRKISDITKSKLSFTLKGKTKTKEHLKKISEALKGRTYEDLHGTEKANELKERLSLKIKLLHPKGMLGKHHSDETKKKISLKHKGHIVSIETRKKCSESHKGEKAYQFNNYASREPYGKEFSPELKNIIREQYLYRCQNCNKLQLLPKLVVHHIDKNKKNNNKENLTILCRSCHAKYHCKDAFKNKQIKLLKA